MWREREIYIYIYIYNNRRKFTSQSSDNMDRWWQMKKQKWEESEKRREEERRSKKRKHQKKEDPGARKGRKVVKHCVFPMICGSGGSKSRLASGGCGASWPDERWKIARRCGAKHISKSKCTNHTNVRPLLAVVMLKKCTPLWRKASQNVKSTICGQLTTSVYWFIHYYT